MAKQKRSRQTWWLLYALALMMVGLIILAHYLAPSPGWRIFLEAGVVVGGYGLMTLWVETHSSVLLNRPSTKAESQAIESPELEQMSSLLSSPVQFYAGSAPAIIYGMSEHSTDNLRANGHHHLAETTPSLPEEGENY